MTKFCIFTTPRTGSTLLVKSLDAHPEIICAGELFFFKGDIFHNEYKFPFWNISFLPAKINYVINYPKIWLTLNSFMKKFFSAEDKSLKAKGFKLMQFQTYYTPGILDYLKKNNIKVIVLIRKNVLRNTLSDLRARHSGVYHNENGVKVAAKFSVDLEELGRKMQQIEGFNRQLEKQTEGMNRKIVYYEDFENWDAAMDDILKYLEVKSTQVTAASKKLNPENLSDMIENYTAFSEWLQQKGYSKYAE